jgi:serine protease Do
MNRHRFAAIVLIAWASAACSSAAWAGPDGARSKPDIPTLEDVSLSFQRLARRVLPSVVSIRTSGFSLGRGAGGVSLTRSRATGSGAIVSADGFIVTNGHVVAGAEIIEVRVPLARPAATTSVLSPNGPWQRARLIGLDPETDLALLQIDARLLPPLAFGDSEALRPGELVFAFGSPLGLDNSVSMGVVSASARQLNDDSAMIYVQTDAAINPGSSGGPLVNARGELVGINTLIASQGGGNEGVGFAAPSNIVRPITAALRADGYVRRGTLGIVAQTITPALARGLGLGQSFGVLVADVLPGSPAALSDVSAGDVIVALNDKPMENARQFSVNQYAFRIGESVTLTVLRGEQRLQRRAAVAERRGPNGRFSDWVNPMRDEVPALGVLVVDFQRDMEALVGRRRTAGGVLVAAPAPGTPLEATPFQLGDTIVQVNSRRILHRADLESALTAFERPWALQIERENQLLFVTVE